MTREIRCQDRQRSDPRLAVPAAGRSFTPRTGLRRRAPRLSPLLPLVLAVAAAPEPLGSAELGPEGGRVTAAGRASLSVPAGAAGAGPVARVRVEDDARWMLTPVPEPATWALWGWGAWVWVRLRGGAPGSPPSENPGFRLAVTGIATRSPL